MTEMPERFGDVAFSPAVLAQQERLGSRGVNRRAAEKRPLRATVTPVLAEFLALCRSFYLGTAGADGQPYIQHRGGPTGFLKPLSARRLAFADFAGNRHYITLGHLSENPRAFLFLMDYANQQRIKLWGTASVVENDPELLARLVDPAYTARPERAIVFEIAEWHTNCRQHIPRLVAAEEVDQHIARLERRIVELERAGK
ncbi:MAG: pyridoxamine 5'-phosphate oxidase family protein [Proteobacteria bacterium]|nr:pyridoxamine 5'-phosphate oxidase family protein [Pseudomonadota bacterium]MBI3499796.1 pyridoxamine 5'-phosphate oxidase family protein [Pseudomonadota bacterium]